MNGVAIDPTKLLPTIVAINPTALDSWLRCPRLFLDRHVLRLPPSDDTGPTDRGLLVHDLLRFVHEHGSCRDRDHVDDVLGAHGLDDDAYRGFVDRHARRCPSGASRARHEFDVARFHRRPAPMFMASARIDAIWGFDDLVDARDYKTGARNIERVADDPRARLQVWILAHDRYRRGRRLRLRYEFLGPDVDDDPEPFEPDDDDLATIGDELRAAVAAMWSSDWRGVSEPSLCRWCPYRSICPDSATPGETSWPALLAGSDDEPEQ